MLKRALRYSNSLPHGRLAGFAVVGGTVFVAGAVLLFGLVHYARVEPHLAYFITAVFSVESSFILNRAINWNDRPGRLRSQLAAFHLTKIGTIALNQVLFAVLLALGLWYMAAMVLITAFITLINYLANDRFVFRSRRLEPVPAPGELDLGSYS